MKHTPDITKAAVAFTITAADFYTALDAVRHGIERRNTIPILSCCRITGTSTGMSIKATNLDQEYGHVTEGNFPPFDICVEFRELHAFVKAQRGEELTVDLTDGFALKGFKYATDEGVHFVTLPAKDHPDFPVWDFEADVTFNPAIFAKVRSAISTEETRYYLNGLYFDSVKRPDGKSVFSIVATDGHRLKKYDTDIAYEGPSVIIPKGFLAFLDKATEGVMSVCPQGVRFVHGATTTFSKVIDGKFPDYTRVIPVPKAGNWCATIPRLELLKVLSVFRTLIPKYFRAAKLSFAHQGVTIECRDLNGAKRLRMDICPHDDGEFEIGLNPAYIEDMLRSYTGDSVTLEFADASSPIRVFADGLTYVLMPLRV